jgi:hypothetical protein
LASTNLATANIKNNISYDAQTAFISYYNLTATNVTVSYNLSDTLEKTGTTAGVTFSNSLEHTSPGFLDAAGNDFHLSAGSAAINAGTNVGYPFIGTAPDIGAYEFGASTSSVAPPQNLTIK